ncbi:MAG: LTA synthase family protein [Erysipelotrichaceae bacterium]|nr:LTA synthase family protein [Erysipelotrichaceae bacterium]
MLLTNYIYFGIFGTFFSFKSLGLAGEAQGYFKIIFDYMDMSLIIVILISIGLGILACRFMPKDKIRGDKILSLLLILSSLSCYGAARSFLGEAADINEWDTWTNKRNVYNSFSDTRKSLQTSGFYEYTMRDIYLSKIQVLFENNEEDIAYLNKYYESYDSTEKFSSEKDSVSSDGLKGIFKDKNIILVLMESVDNWMVNDELMPTLTRLMEEGINFTNHYSPIYGGGATFNAEFMLNTGYMTPLNGENASNKYGHNYFPYSLPNLFANSNYNVNSFHENVSSFYNRGQMSKAFGYENYYSSVELGVPLADAVKDSHFITNDKIRNLLFKENGKTMNFITTYTTHTPYTIRDVQCSETITEKDLILIEKGSNEEELCVKAQARETDNFFHKLIEHLDKEDILDKTIIIGVTDHYAYGYSNKEKLHALKGTDDPNFMSNLPFFIWGNNIPKAEITKVNNNLDVLPTIAYLFGLDYEEKHYVGKNIFDPNYEGFVFFPDHSWYDGNIYYKDGHVLLGEQVEQEYINSRNKQLRTILDVNDKVLNTDYFRILSTK